jgi:tetratricopeptide (TPR) repeat protein
MTEALISALAKIRALKVISRTSVMHYKHTPRRVPQIARELVVDAVVEGTVLLTNQRVRVSVQLVRAATDEHLWAKSYDRDLGDVLSLHACLARAIAREVRAIVTPNEEERLGRSPRVDPVAQEANLRARHFFAKLTAPWTERAIAEFKKAVARDHSFAEANAGLAHACFARAVPLGSGLGVADQRELLINAKAAATRALNIDGTLAEAHAALGLILLFHDWNWREAERALECALEFGANSPYAHGYRAVLASTKLDRSRTLRELRLALQLDPLNLSLHAEAAEVCFWIRDYPQAIEYASQTLDLEPAFPRAHFVLGRVFEAQGRIDEAITEYQQAGMITTEEATSAGRALQQDGAAGYHRWALAVGLEAMGAHTPGGTGGAPHLVGDRPFFRARIYARLGEADQAMTCLEQSYEERDCLLVLLKAQEWWDPLRSDARFVDLVRRIGIP